MDLRTKFQHVDQNNIFNLLSYNDHVEMAKEHLKQGIPNGQVMTILLGAKGFYVNNREIIDLLDGFFQKLNYDFPNDYSVIPTDNLLDELDYLSGIIDNQIQNDLTYDKKLDNMPPLDAEHAQSEIEKVRDDLNANRMDLFTAGKRLDQIGSGISNYVDSLPEAEQADVHEDIMPALATALSPFLPILEKGEDGDRDVCLDSIDMGINELKHDNRG